MLNQDLEIYPRQDTAAFRQVNATLSTRSIWEAIYDPRR